jgi:MFS family permease
VTPVVARRTRPIERDLALFRLYRFLSTSYLFGPAIVVFFGARGLSVTEVTLLNSVYCVTAMLFEVPTGVLADRWGRKRAMVLGSLMMAAGCLINWEGHSFPVFAVGEGLLALGMTLTSGADSAYLYDLLRAAGRAHEYRRREGAASAAKLVGAAAALAVGGWLAHRDVGATYLFTAAICLAASLVAALLGETVSERTGLRAVADGGEAPVPTGMVAQIAGSARRVLDHPPLLFAVAFSTLIFTLTRMSIYLHQPFLSAAGLDLSHVGLVMAALSLLAALGAHRIEWLRRALGESTLVWGLPAVLALSYLVMGRWFATWGVALLGLQALASGVYSPLSKELLNREIVDSGRRATILSVESMARRLAFGLFAPLVGWMIDRDGLGAGLWACAALALVGTVVLAVRATLRRRAYATGFEGERTPTPTFERPLVEPEEAAAPVAVARSAAPRA